MATAGVRHQRRAPRSAPRPQITFDDTGRKTARPAAFASFRGAERRLLRGLEHHGVAGGERRRQLPGRHQQRVVSTARSTRPLPPGSRRIMLVKPAAIFPGNGAVHGAGRPREEAETHPRWRGISSPTHGGQRLAAIFAIRSRRIRRHRSRCDRRVFRSKRGRVSFGGVAAQAAKAACAAANGPRRSALSRPRVPKPGALAAGRIQDFLDGAPGPRPACR